MHDNVVKIGRVSGDKLADRRTDRRTDKRTDIHIQFITTLRSPTVHIQPVFDKTCATTQKTLSNVFAF